MSYKEVSIQHLILFIIQISNPYHSLVEIELVNIFIKSVVKPEREHNVTWVLKTIVLLCQTVINKMLLTLLLMLHSVQVDKDAWL